MDLAGYWDQFLSAAKAGKDFRFTVQQESFGFMHLTVTYTVRASRLRPDQFAGAFVAIMDDFAYRFEQYEVLPYSSFANGDLPASHFGAVATTRYKIPERYLAEVFGSYNLVYYNEEIPPTTRSSVAFPPYANFDPSPKVQIGGQWQNVPWPSGLQVADVPMGPNTWYPNEAWTVYGIVGAGYFFDQNGVMTGCTFCGPWLTWP